MTIQKIQSIPWRPLALAGTILIAAASAQADDDIASMCDKADGAQGYETCECALNAIKDDLSDTDLAIYTRVSTLYFENLANGMGMSDAWTKAAGAAGKPLGMSSTEIIKITNPIGRAHRNANKGCPS